MAHELEIMENGQASMMYVGDVPWHGLGTYVENEVTAAAAIKLAGLDWESEKRELFIQGENEVDGIPVIGQKVPDKFAVTRMTDNKILGVVGSDYEIIQNLDAFEFMDSIIGEGQAVYHTAGSLFGGRRIFMTVKLPGEISVGPDSIQKYLVLASGHDGSFALHVKWTPIRVVCWNTLNAALEVGRNGKPRNSVSIRHTRNYKQNISEARELLQLTDYYYQQIEKCFNRLIDTQITVAGVKEFTEQLLPLAKDDEGNEKASKYIQTRRDEIVDLTYNGKGQDAAEVRGTRWAAYNAVTEFVDHQRKYYVRDGSDQTSEAVEMVGKIWGGGAMMKQRAFELLKVR